MKSKSKSVWNKRGRGGREGEIKDRKDKERDEDVSDCRLRNEGTQIGDKERGGVCAEEEEGGEWEGEQRST